MSARRYKRETTIVGLNGSVFALEFSPDRGVLACGCEDGSVTVFSTFTWKPLHIFVNVSPSTSLTWHPHIEGLLFCGFKSGDVHALQTNHTRTIVGIRTYGNRNPVHCISHDPRLNFLAVGSGKNVVLAKYNAQGGHTVSWSKARYLPSPPEFPQLRGTELPEPAAQSIHFTHGQDSIIVSYLHHGVTCWDRASLSLIWQITPRSYQIGRSCLLSSQEAIAVTNLFDGVDFYDLKNQSLASSLRVEVTENIVTPIISDNAGSMIVGGSTGVVQVLQPIPAAVIQTLELENGRIIQALAHAPQLDGGCLLAAGTSGLGSQTVVTVWRSEKDRNHTTGLKGAAVSFLTLLNRIFVPLLMVSSLVLLLVIAMY